MTARTFFPTTDPTAQRAFKASADELLDGLLIGYKHAAQNFLAPPRGQMAHPETGAHSLARCVLV